MATSLRYLHQHGKILGVSHLVKPFSQEAGMLITPCFDGDMVLITNLLELFVLEHDVHCKSFY